LISKATFRSFYAPKSMADHLDQDSEAPGTSSSQAFADLQRQRSTGPSSRTRSQASEAFQTQAQGQTPLHAAMSSIAEVIEVQRGLRQAARNQPSPGPPDFEDDPNYGIRVHAHQNPNRTLVTKYMFEKIDSFHLKLLQDNVISISGTDHMKRWLKIKSILEQIDVLTLLPKLRTRPITDRETNVYGYTEGYTAVHEGRVFTISPDDIHKFTFDMRKTFIVMDIIFDESFHHISQEGFLQHDGIQIFQDATKHFEGHEAKDVIFHHQNLHRFRPTLPMSFRKLDDLMRRVEQVTGKPQSDIEKLAIFLNHFHADSSPGVAVRIQTMVLMPPTRLCTNQFAKCPRSKRLPTIVLCLSLSLQSSAAAAVLAPALTSTYP
jgi:hypothetical protein